MSMLAEPRRKQKWSVDPRNSAWSNDDSKFGQKMLERMGWSKGKGLGRTEQGSTDHIKVSVKNNNYGLGANASHEDNWIAHQDDFNELLAQLNNCHSQNNSNESAADDQKGFSLEEKSKTSRKRVHYMKFTKGKDLSSRSETDLNCIFGKRSRSSRDPEQDGSSSDSQVDTDGARTPCELEPETITKTVTSSLTMQEYFAQRMAQLKKARGASAAPEEPNQDQDQDQTEEPKKKKKQKKRRKEEEMEEKVEVIAEDQDQQEPSKKKKKKKRITTENFEVNCSASCGVEENYNQPPAAEKKKKKKSKNQNKDELNKHEVWRKCGESVESEEGQKKKDDVREEDSEEKKPKKKKKKKHLE
ncbi:PIN2/TERF1-interacting telomerase inhibitor 1 [Acanthochromis polyacanthus]|uniref:PIN2/TERF1-interacting telomerase inhibitor 1 n=1 Tax=Acanthochromis polyacanthus TaxID=80966 RepID=UPI0022345B4C|nr:PIN2/TERF1-interacting telomerase inhibitor 1 [Acanthochromis polyacanthus]